MTQQQLEGEQAITAFCDTSQEWAREGQVLAMTVTADSFASAIALVQAVAEAAERMNHHPDIDIRWRTVTFRLTTHSAGGITALDLALAQEISSLASSA